MKKTISIVLFALSFFTEVYGQNESNQAIKTGQLIIECNCEKGLVIIDTIESIQNAPVFLLRIQNCSESEIKTLPAEYFDATQIEINSDTASFNIGVLRKFKNTKTLVLSGKAVTCFPKSSFLKSKSLTRLFIKNTSISRFPRRIIRMKIGEFSFQNGELKKIPKWFDKTQISYSVTIGNSGVSLISSSIFNCPTPIICISEKNAEVVIDKKSISEIFNKEFVSLLFNNNDELFEQLQLINNSAFDVFMDTSKTILFPVSNN